MIEGYLFVPKEDADNVVECGLKLSRWADRNLFIGDEEERFVSMLLNPKDDIEKYNSETYKCLKIEIPNDICRMADRTLFLEGQQTRQALDLYIKSIIPVEEYIFGMYRVPEILVSCTILPDKISFADKWRDSPVLFNDSQELYINNLVETLKEDNDSFNDTLMHLYFCKLCELGRIQKVSGKGAMDIFIDENAAKTYTVRKPDFSGDNKI